MGRFKRLWEDLIPPTEQLDPAFRKNRSSDERSQSLFDGPFNAIATNGNMAAVANSRSMDPTRTATCSEKTLPTENRRGWDASNIAETTVNKGCGELQNRHLSQSHPQISRTRGNLKPRPIGQCWATWPLAVPDAVRHRPPQPRVQWSQG